jgi:mannose-1-phosphate guanylyltransferase / mannose-6-phosphate isomerase
VRIAPPKRLKYHEETAIRQCRAHRIDRRRDIVRPVILSGGAGTRLWPISRKNFPKQLLPIIDHSSLLQLTGKRVSNGAFADPIVVAGEDHRFFVKRQLDEAGVTPEAILLEPAGRNTAAAAALAAEWVRAQGRDDVLLVVPSDHMIGDDQAFLSAVEKAVPFAEEGGIVTFGIKPTGPNTQYGYIEIGDEDTNAAAVPVVRFVEKPTVELAEALLGSGRCVWNAGIFLMKASTLLEEMERYLPSSRDAISKSIAQAQADGNFVRPNHDLFVQSENISIDHGIMQKTDRAFVTPVDMDWSDVGSWDAVWRINPKDDSENVTSGEVVALDTHRSVLRSEGGALLAAVGLNDMVVVAARDAVFVAPLARANEVRQIVEQLQREDKAGYVIDPAKVERPWGSFETLGTGPRFQIKHINVAPGETLSLQMHFHRSEHWVVVGGTAQVTVGERQFLLNENESTYIPAGEKHRLANPGKVPLQLIEVQCGTYLGEDDIVRLEDDYGRS